MKTETLIGLALLGLFVELTVVGYIVRIVRKEWP